MMQITFLDTNGWYDTVTGNTSSVLILAEKYDVILDAGNGIAKADRYITGEKPTYLFISHFHLDHIVSLHTLVIFRFKKGLHICGQKGLMTTLNTFINEPFTNPWAQLPCRVEFKELNEGQNTLDFPVE